LHAIFPCKHRVFAHAARGFALNLPHQSTSTLPRMKHSLNCLPLSNSFAALPDAEYGTLRRSAAGLGPRHPDQLLHISPGDYT